MSGRREAGKAMARHLTSHGQWCPHKRGGVEHRSWEAKRKRVVSRGRRRQRGAARERAIPERYDAPPPAWMMVFTWKREKGRRVEAVGADAAGV
eukprot:scaffold2431_cov116-Isochrysis_galbana.AAC.2